MADNDALLVSYLEAIQAGVTRLEARTLSIESKVNTHGEQIGQHAEKISDLEGRGPRSGFWAGLGTLAGAAIAGALAAFGIKIQL